MNIESSANTKEYITGAGNLNNEATSSKSEKFKLVFKMVCFIDFISLYVSLLRLYFRFSEHCSLFHIQ